MTQYDAVSLVIADFDVVDGGVAAACTGADYDSIPRASGHRCVMNMRDRGEAQVEGCPFSDAESCAEISAGTR